MKVIKRDGNIVEYNPEKIKTAIKKQMRRFQEETEQTKKKYKK